MITCSSFSQLTISRRELTKNAFPKTQNSNSGDVFTNASIAVNDKVQKSFNKYFVGATKQNWSMIAKDFHSTFYVNGVFNQALLGRKGNLIYTISYGTEKEMPSEVRKIVKSEYYDYTITVAIEIKDNKRDIWIINMTNDNSYLIVKVEDGEMDRINQFKKSM